MIGVGLTDLLGCLRLRRLTDDVVEGPNLDIGYHRIFGGQILAQLLVAATEAIPDKSLRSLSVRFPREGDASRPMRYRTTVHQRGRTFATVGVIGFQVDADAAADDPEVVERVVAVATASLHVDEAGLHHSDPAPSVGAPTDASPQTLDLIPWEVRVVDAVDLAERAVGPPHLDWWMRAEVPTPAPEDGGSPFVERSVHQALVAHATDLTVIGTALRPIEGISQADSTEAIATAVTGHSLWFHQPFRMDEWLLVSQEAPILAHGRAFGRGDVFAGDELVASFAQESMVRGPSPDR